MYNPTFNIFKVKIVMLPKYYLSNVIYLIYTNFF